MLENLEKYNILLASKSPRRRELLSELRIPFTVISIGINESYPADMPPEDVPVYLSRKKADAYRRLLQDDELVITSDTVVVLEGRILEKPKSIEEAGRMLKDLSGRTHKVVTGVTIMTSARTSTFDCVTAVTFSELSSDEIEYYVRNFRPLDKAGAYGIQEWIGCVAVSKIEGSFYNVMGLPVHRLYRELQTF